MCIFFFKQKTAYEMRISDWSSDVCSSDLMAFRIILPPLTSEFLGVIKNSALASILGLMELTGVARTMQEYTFHAFEAFAGATLMYCVINIVVVRIMQRVERVTAVAGYTVMHNKKTAAHTG